MDKLSDQRGQKSNFRNDLKKINTFVSLFFSVAIEAKKIVLLLNKSS